MIVDGRIHRQGQGGENLAQKKPGACVAIDGGMFADQPKPALCQRFEHRFVDKTR
jgi:hypothetical protein